MMPRFRCAFILAAACAASAASAQPAIGFLQTDVRPTLGGALIVIQGSNFSASPTVLFNGVSTPVIVSSSTRIVCQSLAGENTATLQVIGGGSSNVFSYTYDAPKITSFAPTSGPVLGTNTMSILGTNFGLNPAVTIGGVNAGLTSHSHTLITATVPPGIGTNKTVAVIVPGFPGVSIPQSYAYTAPAVFLASPSFNLATVGGSTVTLSGSNLGLSGFPLPTVTIGGQPVSSSFIDDTQVQATMPPGAGLNVPVTLSVGGQTATLSNGISYGGPQISTFTPTNGPTAGGTTVTIYGQNFGPSGTPVTVKFNATQSPSAFVSVPHSRVTCTVPEGEGVFNTITLTVAGPIVTYYTTPFIYDAPHIDQVRPSSGPAVGGTPIIIEGSNFGLNPIVTIAGQAAPVVARTHTRLACLAPVRPGSSGLANAQVIVSVGTLNSNSGSYSYVCSSDFNADGTLAVQDIFDFLNAWFSGCP